MPFLILPRQYWVMTPEAIAARAHQGDWAGLVPFVEFAATVGLSTALGSSTEQTLTRAANLLPGTAPAPAMAPGPVLPPATTGGWSGSGLGWVVVAVLILVFIYSVKR